MEIKYAVPKIYFGNESELIIEFGEDCFSVLYEGELYSFIPTRSTQIRLNIQTEEVLNEEDIFDFKSTRKKSFFTVGKLLEIPMFKQLVYHYAQKEFQNIQLQKQQVPMQQPHTSITEIHNEEVCEEKICSASEEDLYEVMADFDAIIRQMNVDRSLALNNKSDFDLLINGYSLLKEE